MKKIILGAVISLLFVVGCGKSSKNSDPNLIRVGITSGPEQEIAETAKKVAKEKYGLEVELVTFSDYVMPNEALNQGDIDANAFQHIPYLEEQSQHRGYKLAVVGKTFVYPIVAYSKKVKQKEELKKGDRIVIPNDPSNGGRALLLLQKNSLITLSENVGLLPKLTDIASNPLDLQFLEIEAPQLPRILDDKEVVIAIINNNFAAQAGLNSEQYGIFSEEKDSPYVNVIVSRQDNQEEEKIKNFVKAYQSEEVEAVAKKIFKDGAVKGW